MSLDKVAYAEYEKSVQMQREANLIAESIFNALKGKCVHNIVPDIVPFMATQLLFLNQQQAIIDRMLKSGSLQDLIDISDPLAVFNLGVSVGIVLQHRKLAKFEDQLA